jgi:hypothetical protein
MDRIFVEARSQDRPSRFAAAPRAPAAGLLVALACLIAIGLWLSPATTVARRVSGDNDVALYRAVVDRVRAGEPYEPAAIAEQRSRDFPLKPFVVVRPPALAMALSRLPDERSGDILLALLAAGVIAAWTWRLRVVQAGPVWLAATALTLFTGVGLTMGGGGASLFQEAWAGLLIALSLALRSEKRFVAAVLIGLLAAVTRELAMPYLAVMALLAIFERRRLEAGCFAAALGLALALLALHASAVMSLVRPDDLASPSWVRLGGWPFVLTTARWNLLALLIGGWSGAVILPMSLIGATGWKNGSGLRLAALLLGYTLGFMAIGRPENNYWGLLVAPLAAVGLCLAPMALRDLVRGALGANRGGGGIPDAEPASARLS